MTTITLNPQTYSALTVTVSGVAAANTKKLGVHFDFVLATIDTTLGQSAADAATALKAAIDLVLPTGYTAELSGAVITISRAAQGLIYAYPISQDTTQVIALTGSGCAERVHVGVTTANTGYPAGANSGYALYDESAAVEAGAHTVIVRVTMRNGSAGAKTAYWRLWWYSPGIGWNLDQQVGVRSITDAGATPYATHDVIAVVGFGTRVAVELIGSAATGTSLSGTGHSVDVWLAQAATLYPNSGSR